MNNLRTYYKEILLVTALCIALLLATVGIPGLYMPDMLAMAWLLLFVILLALFIAFIWRNKPRDERESYLEHYSGRIAYTLGIVVLATGNVTQALTHSIDPWLAIALVVMVIGKVVARLVLENK